MSRKLSERSLTICSLAVVAASAMVAGGCAKKVAVAKPADTPAPPAVVATNTPPPASRPTQTAPAPVQQPETARPRVPDAATRARIDQLLAKIEDAYFDYDRAALRPDAVKALEGDSAELRDILKDYPDYKLTIEGHCDERGSAEYNLALGEKRADAAKQYLVGVGIPSVQLNTVSYGKERPSCSEPTEACYQKNRRVHIIAAARP